MKPRKSLFLGLAITCSLLLSIARCSFALDVGAQAPDFELESTKGGKLRLSSLRGKNVLINFYVFDYSPT